MRENRTYGSVRGALSNERPYRNPYTYTYSMRLCESSRYRNEADRAEIYEYAP